MEERLLILAKRFWPQLETMSGEERRVGVFDVIGVLYSAPLALVGILWLIAETNLTLMRHEGLMLAIFFILQILFARFDFFLLVEIIPGNYSGWQSSLGPVIIWSAALIFGPSALWLFVIWWLIWFVPRWWKAPTSVVRWHSLRNFLFNLACVTFAGLVALTLLSRILSADVIRGVYPLPGLSFKIVLPELIATLVWWFLSTLIWLPLFIYYAITHALAGVALRTFTRYWAITTGSHLLVDPFAVLAARLYSTFGLGGFLFFAAGLLIASFVAHQLSRAVERSEQRTRELSKLEQLGRAILVCCPDLSDLPDVLRDHVPNMFPYSQIEIRADRGPDDPNPILLRYPEEITPVVDSAWEWLFKTGEARVFLPGKTLPWTENTVREGLVIAPVLDVESRAPIGGMYLARSRDPESISSLLPAVQSLAAQIASALHGAEVYNQTLAHQRVEQELALAAEIQNSFLPDDIPHLPGWQIVATLKPARETSGDFYDFIPLPDGKIGILIADVADKGMGAALYMAFSRTLIRSCAVECCTQPDQALSTANRRILEDARADMFVTVFYGILDPVSGILVYCNAGHNPPYLIKASSRDGLQALHRTGMALGVIEDAEWERETVQMAQDDVLVLYTDGITDAVDARGEIFDEESLQEVLRANQGRSALGIQDAIMSQVNEFIGDAPQFDDTTLMVLVRDSTPGEMPPAQVK